VKDADRSRQSRSRRDPDPTPEEAPEPSELQRQIQFLEEETALLRRRLQDSPRQVRVLEERLLETKGQLAQALSQNERLAATLREAREQIIALKEEVEKLTAPPSGFGVFLGVNDDGTINISSGGRKLRVNVHPDIDPKSLQPGQELMLNEALNVVEACTYEVQGDLVTERLRWSLGGAEEAETYHQRLYADDELAALVEAAGLQLVERRPMWPAIPAEPARGRTLWIARPQGR